MACWRLRHSTSWETTWWCWPPVLKNAVSHDGAARIPGTKGYVWSISGRYTQWSPLQMFASLLCDLNQTLFGFKQEEWLLLSATEAWLVCLLNQHLSDRALNISLLCVCVCVCVCRLSLVAVNGSYSPVVVHGLLIAVASFFVEQRP